MSERHTVEQGETMASIASAFGFLNFETLWNDPENAELKKLRRDPQVLFPGDVVVIPDKEGKKAAINAGTNHTFRVTRKALNVRVALLDLKRRPRANVDVSVGVEGEESRKKTDGDGKIEVPVKASTRKVGLLAPEGELSLAVGVLDPVDQVSGWQARLQNLGYFLGEVGDESNVDESNFALRLFQADEGLGVTGEADDATRGKLVEVHGS
jgi:N-acetylmuramoyl-L-alanine amidase